jgi:hypothetical protein
MHPSPGYVREVTDLLLLLLTSRAVGNEYYWLLEARDHKLINFPLLLSFIWGASRRSTLKVVDKPRMTLSV